MHYARQLIAGLSLNLLMMSQYSLYAAPSANDLLVVANIDNAELSLSKQQVKSLFMGSLQGYDFIVATLPPSSLERVKFNTLVIGLTEERIQSYWAQMQFTGRKFPPKQIETISELLNFMEQTPGAVSYLPASIALPASLKVLYRVSVE
jgi:hypothetical protein